MISPSTRTRRRAVSGVGVGFLWRDWLCSSCSVIPFLLSRSPFSLSVLFCHPALLLALLFVVSYPVSALSARFCHPGLLSLFCYALPIPPRLRGSGQSYHDPVLVRGRAYCKSRIASRNPRATGLLVLDPRRPRRSRADAPQRDPETRTRTLSSSARPRSTISVSGQQWHCLDVASPGPDFTLPHYTTICNIVVMLWEGWY
jgi:hypothetical protein